MRSSAWLRGNVVLAVASIVGMCAPRMTLAAGINTSLALTPPEGGSIFRLQYRYLEADGHGAVRQVNSSSVTGTYVYG